LSSLQTVMVTDERKEGQSDR